MGAGTRLRRRLRHQEQQQVPDDRERQPQPGTRPADPLTDLASRAVRPAIWAGAGSLLVLVLTGVPLVWQYHPGRRLLIQELHAAAALIFLVAALVVAAATGWSRFKDERTTFGPLAATGALVLAVLVGGAGQALAWDSLALNAVVLDPDFQGLTVALDPDVRLIHADDLTLTPDQYAALSVLHLVGLPLLIVLVLLRSARLRRRAE